MKRTILGWTAAIALGLGAAATAPAPSYADADDALGIALGIGAAIIIGNAIANDRKDDNSQIRLHTSPRPVARSSSRYVNDRRFGRPPGFPVQRLNNRRLPSTCIRTVESGNRLFRGYSRNCLLRTVSQADRLPLSCGVPIRGLRGSERLLNARCLQQHGWHIPDRRLLQRDTVIRSDTGKPRVQRN